VLHFHKLGQQRQTANENKSSRPTKYSKSKENTPNFDTIHKQVHNIDSDGCGPPENWEKKFRPPRLESENRTYTPRRDYNPRGGYSNRARDRGRDQDIHLYCMFHERETDHRIRDCPIFLESKKDSKAKLAAKPLCSQRSQHHNPLASTITIFILEPAFIPKP
jgi:hypothetical protein